MPCPAILCHPVPLLGRNCLAWTPDWALPAQGCAAVMWSMGNGSRRNNAPRHPRRLSFLFLLFSPTRRGCWPARQGSSRLARVPAFASPLGAPYGTASHIAAPFFVIGSHRGSPSTTGGVAGRLPEPWRQVFYGGWWMALLPYGHWRSGRPVLPRSHPEQVVAEVGYMSQNSHTLAMPNSKLRADWPSTAMPGQHVPATHGFDALRSCTVDTSGGPETHAGVLTAACCPARLHCRNGRVGKCLEQSFPLHRKLAEACPGTPNSLQIIHAKSSSFAFLVRRTSFNEIPHLFQLSPSWACLYDTPNTSCSPARTNSRTFRKSSRL